MNNSLKILSYFILVLSLSFEGKSSDSLLFRINVLNKGESGKYTRLLTDMEKLFNEVVNSEEFKKEVLSYHFDWENTASYRSDTITNQGVFDSLFKWTNATGIRLYFKNRSLNIAARWSETAGKTTVGSNKTITYKHWIDLSEENYQCTLIEYTSHIAHEYCHQRGFYDKNVSDQSKYRNVVPYAIGDIACRLLNRKFSKNCDCLN